MDSGVRHQQCFMSTNGHEIIERQLAHAERNSVVKAYNHAQHLSKRREMMQWWADYLDEIESKALEVD